MSSADINVVISGLRDHDLYERVRGQIQSRWFQTSDLRNIFEIIKRCHTDNPGSVIQWKDLRILLRGQKGYDRVKTIQRQTDGVSKTTHLKTLAKFLEQQMVEDLAGELAKAHENGHRINHDDYIKRLESAKRAGTLSIDRRNLFSEEPKDWITKIESVPVIPLPSFELTQALRGGIAGGRPTTILTRTDGGKTSFAVACGAFAVKKGYKVLHCTLEDSADEIFRRYSCSMLGQTWEWVKTHPKTTQKLMGELRRGGGDLEVADFASIECSLPDIELAASKAQRQWQGIDLIIVDAGDDVRSQTKTELETQKIREVWQGLTRLSRKHGDVPVMVTTQTNRLGAGARQIELTHVAEGWGKATVSAVVIVFDVPKDSKRGYATIVKSKRKGIYPSIPIVFDRERCTVK